MTGNRDKTPLPVFVKSEHLPKDITIYEICAAAEKVSGPVTIDGAICISGLWRISPLYEAARIKILANGISIRGRNIHLENMNPFTMRSGDDSSGTKLFIGNLPFSYSSDAIKNHLRVAGVTLRSEVVWERARGPDGSLSDWKTGRRMVWINIPEKPLNKYMKMGNGFSASLYHKEMKQVAKCHNCFEVGHIAKFCEREVVCLTCKKPGHKRGDPICDLGMISQNDIEEKEGKSAEENYETSTCEDVRTDSSGDEPEDEDSLCSDTEDLARDKEEVSSNSNGVDKQNILGKDAEVSELNEGQKMPEDKEESPKVNEGVREKNDQAEAKEAKTGTSGKTGGKKYKKKDKSKSTALKQVHITDFTPGGKRNSEDMVSPDNIAKGPEMKKLNFDSEQK